MPRAKTVTMGKVTPQQSHDAAIKQCIKRFKPYEVIDGQRACLEPGKYYVFSTNPRGGKRGIIAERNNKLNAIALRDMLCVAWAEGFFANGMSPT